MSNKSKILIIFAKEASETSTRFGGFISRIQKNGGFSYADVDCVALEKLIFRIIDKHTADIYDPVRNIHLSGYDFVYFKSWQSMPELAAAAAIYLEAINVPYADKQVRHGYIPKTTNQMLMWKHDVNVPESIWGSRSALTQLLKTDTSLIFPCILKGVHAEKGHDNYLVENTTDAAKLIEQSTDDMVLQAFIPNDGDYRIGVYGSKARWGIYRKSGGTSHLNNTSAGGTAELLDIATVPSKIRRLAERAAAACDLAVSGVDVIQDNQNGKLYVLEANQGSQIVTGAFTDSNMAAFDRGIRALVRKSSRQKQEKTVIGRTAVVAIVDGHERITVRGKVDSGAYQSAIHAHDIYLEKDNDIQIVHYALTGSDGRVHKRVSSEFWRAEIKSSIGTMEQRFVVPMQVEIEGKVYNTRVSLTDRSTQKFPFLLGRKLLTSNFIIDVDMTSTGV